MHSIPGEDSAGRIDRQRARPGSGVAERQCAGKSRLRVVGELEQLPVDQTRDAGGARIVPGQPIDAGAAIDDGRRDDIRSRQAGEDGHVVARAEPEAGFEHAAAGPVHRVGSGAAEQETADAAPGDGEDVVAIAEIDEAADAPAGQVERVVVLGRQNVGDDQPARHGQHIVGERHVDRADLAAGDRDEVAFVQPTGDDAAGHRREIEFAALVDVAVDRAAGHHEAVDAIAEAAALVDGAVHQAAAHDEGIGSVALADIAIDGAGIVDDERRVPRADDIAVDRARGEVVDGIEPVAGKGDCGAGSAMDLRGRAADAIIDGDGLSRAGGAGAGRDPVGRSANDAAIVKHQRARRRAGGKTLVHADACAASRRSPGNRRTSGIGDPDGRARVALQEGHAERIAGSGIRRGDDAEIGENARPGPGPGREGHAGEGGGSASGCDDRAVIVEQVPGRVQPEGDSLTGRWCLLDGCARRDRDGDGRVGRRRKTIGVRTRAGHDRPGSGRIGYALCLRGQGREEPDETGSKGGNRAVSGMSPCSGRSKPSPHMHGPLVAESGHDEVG
ncbi:hypothetical protein AB4Z40_19200 [Bosea sp. 2YAB26]|uniref:hypothetical protein n=1 Tax=Bosea sp. 2YAB26 TaxID=3237478 RepID=UPI003F8F0BD7